MHTLTNTHTLTYTKMKFKQTHIDIHRIDGHIKADKKWHETACHPKLNLH